jgi:hypothetical protein
MNMEEKGAKDQGYPTTALHCWRYIDDKMRATITSIAQCLKKSLFSLHIKFSVTLR